MVRYKRHSYKEDPIISSELVKFMAVNAGFEALEILTANVSSMELDVLVMKKEAVASAKASQLSVCSQQS